MLWFLYKRTLDYELVLFNDVWQSVYVIMYDMAVSETMS